MWIRGSFLLQIFQKRTLRIRKFTGTRKSLKTHAYRSKKVYKTSKNSTDESESQNIYASMEGMSINAETPRRNYGYSSQLTNCILNSGVTFHMKPEI